MSGISRPFGDKPSFIVPIPVRPSTENETGITNLVLDIATNHLTSLFSESLGLKKEEALDILRSGLTTKEAESLLRKIGSRADLESLLETRRSINARFQQAINNATSAPELSFSAVSERETHPIRSETPKRGGIFDATNSPPRVSGVKRNRPIFSGTPSSGSDGELAKLTSYTLHVAPEAAAEAQRRQEAERAGIDTPPQLRLRLRAVAHVPGEQQARPLQALRFPEVNHDEMSRVFGLEAGGRLRPPPQPPVLSLAHLMGRAPFATGVEPVPSPKSDY